MVPGFVIALLLCVGTCAYLGWRLQQTRRALDEVSERLQASETLRAEGDERARRLRREVEDESALSRTKTIEELLVLDDHVARAIGSCHSDVVTSSIEQGVELLARDLDATWKRMDLESVPASEGQRFDPEIHEAVASNPGADVSEAQIHSVVARGFRLGPRLVRPARVVVDVPSPASSEEASDENEKSPCLKASEA